MVQRDGHSRPHHSRDEGRGRESRPRAGRGQASSPSRHAGAPARQSGKHVGAHSRIGGDVEITYSRRLANGDAIARPERDSYTRKTFTRVEEEEVASRSVLRILVLVLASVIYWPIVIVGVTAPFMEGFNPGTLAMGQIVFSRVWLAFVMLGAIYLAVTNIGHFRDLPIFRASGKAGKLLKIIVFLLADIAISFAVIRIVCFL